MIEATPVSEEPTRNRSSSCQLFSIMEEDDHAGNEEISTKKNYNSDISEARTSLKCHRSLSSLTSNKLSTAREEETHGYKNSTGNK